MTLNELREYSAETRDSFLAPNPPAYLTRVSWWNNFDSGG